MSDDIPRHPVDGPRSPVRRHALRLLGTAAGGLAAGAAPLVSGCAPRRDPDEVTRVPLEDIPVGKRVRVTHQDDPVELVRHASGVRARLLVCTHEYCTVFWHRRDSVYHCPCHAGRWDPAGQPLSGPVSEPLTTLDARVVDDHVTIRFRDETD